MAHKGACSTPVFATRDSLCLSCCRSDSEESLDMGCSDAVFRPVCAAVATCFLPPEAPASWPLGPALTGLGDTRGAGHVVLCFLPLAFLNKTILHPSMNHSSSWILPIPGNHSCFRARVHSDVTVEVLVTFTWKWNGTRSLVSETIQRMEMGLVGRTRRE